jgi:hypothetical protein
MPTDFFTVGAASTQASVVLLEDCFPLPRPPAHGLNVHGTIRPNLHRDVFRAARCSRLGDKYRFAGCRHLRRRPRSRKAVIPNAKRVTVKPNVRSSIATTESVLQPHLWNQHHMYRGSITLRSMAPVGDGIGVVRCHRQTHLTRRTNAHARALHGNADGSRAQVDGS